MLEDVIFLDKNFDGFHFFQNIKEHSLVKDYFLNESSYDSQDVEKALNNLNLKNTLREISYQLIFRIDDLNIKEYLRKLTNEKNIWILLNYLINIYDKYNFDSSKSIKIIAQYNTIFEDIISIIFDFKMSDKILDHDLEFISEFLENEIFSKIFLKKLYECIIMDEKTIEYKLNHIFGGFFKIFISKFKESKLEKIFYNFFLEKLFEKYDVLERAIINRNQFFTKREKLESYRIDSDQVESENNREFKLSKIENEKIQIENILKYIYNESYINNLDYICKCLIKFCNENRIILIEDKNRNIKQNRLYFMERREVNTEIGLDLEENKDEEKKYKSSDLNNLSEFIFVNENNQSNRNDEKQKTKRDKNDKKNKNETAKYNICNKNKKNKEVLKSSLIEYKNLLENKRLRSSDKDKKNKDVKNILSEKRTKKVILKNEININNNSKTNKKLNFDNIDDTTNDNNIRKSERKKGDLLDRIKKIDLKENQSKQISKENKLNMKNKLKLSNTLKNKKYKENISASLNLKNKIDSESPDKKMNSICKSNDNKVNITKNNINNKDNNSNNTPKRYLKKVELKSVSPKRSERITKKNSFESIQDSIRLKKTRSMSTSRSRFPLLNSVEKSNEESPVKTRYSSKLVKNDSDITVINEKLNFINKPLKIESKKNNQNINQTSKRDSKSSDINNSNSKSYSNSRDRTPEKYRSPLKNQNLTEKKVMDLRSSSKKNSAKKERIEKIKFGISVYKEFDPKIPVKSLSYNLKFSPGLKNNLINKKSNLKKSIIINHEKIENKTSRNSSKNNSPSKFSNRKTKFF